MITKFTAPSRRRTTLLFALAAALIAVTLTDLPTAFANPGADEHGEAQLLMQSIMHQFQLADDSKNVNAQAQKITDLIEDSPLSDAVIIEALKRQAEHLERAGDTGKRPATLRYLAGYLLEEAGGPSGASPQTLHTVQTLRQAGTMMYRKILQASLGEDLPAEATSVPAAFRWRECPAVSHAQLQAQLGDDVELPSLDAWGRPLDFCMRIDPRQPIGWIGVRSPGSDGIFEQTYHVGAFEAGRSESDIVWFSGYFLRWPQT